MKKPFLIVFFFALCLRVFAATETIDLSAQGFADGTQVSVVEGDAVKLTFTDGGTPTAYYTSGSAVRLYNGGTMTVTCDFTMSKIVFDYVLDGIATVSVSQATFDSETKTWEGSLSSVVLTAETAKHVRIKSVTVTYESGSTSDEGGTYELVTSSTTLAAGDKCVVLDFEGGYAVGTIGGDAAAAISSGFTLTGTTVTIPSTTTDIAVFTLEASQTEGAFYLKSSLNKGKYLQLTASSINVATSTTGVDLYISTDADNNFTKIACSQETNRSLSYYPNNYFKNYATPLASGKYKPVKMYRKTSDTPPVVTTYDVNVASDIANGSVVASAETAAQGATVTLTVTPDENYELESLTVTGPDGVVSTTLQSNGTYTFEMPAGDVTVSATFRAVQTGGGDGYVGAGRKFVLVTDASALGDGSIVMVLNSATAGTQKAIANTQKSNNRAATDVTVTTEGGETIATSTSATEVYQLVAASNGRYGFKAVSESSYYKDKYLAATGGTSHNYLNYVSKMNGTTTDATINVVSGGVAEVAFNFTGRNSMYYNPNNGSPLFNCYSSQGSMGSVYLYQLAPAITLEPVTGIANFARTSDDTNVRLYLPDANDVRVLRVVDNGDGTVDAYVREHTSSDGYCGMVLRGLTPNRPLAYDQHIAGWISGVRATSADGQIEFVADASFTNTTFLVIADLVSEPLTAPNTITSDKLAEHNGDWVTLRELACSVSDGNLVLSDGAGDGPVALNAELASSGYAAPYAGAVVDVAGIASNNTLYPTTIGSVPQITYVVDTEAGYVSPSTSISNTAVRVKRQLIAGQWVPLTLPFAMDVDDFAGDVMAYQSLVDGGTITTGGKQYEVGTMVFEPAESIEAGVPYLVRPTRLITEITSQNGVTLAGGVAQSVSMTRSSGGQNAPGLRRIAATDEYSLVGVYESTAVPTDKTAKIFFADGTVGWATEDDNMVPSTSAYVLSPENQVARLQLGDASPTIITAIDTIEASRPVLAEGIYNLLGMKLNKSWSELPHGIYIVNGVKRVK